MLGWGLPDDASAPMRIVRRGPLPWGPIMLVFAYGTLTVPAVRDRVLGHPVVVRDAVLRGHSKVCGLDYLTIVPSDGCVRGVVFDADDRDVRMMDVWEDVPVYELVPVTVLVDGAETDAFAYVMPEPPADHEAVGDSCVAAIPLPGIIAEIESMMSRVRGRDGRGSRTPGT